VQQLGRLALFALAAAVIPLRRGHLGVPREALHRRDIGAGLQEVADVGAAEIVGRESSDAGGVGQAAQQVEHRRAGHPAHDQVTSLVNGHEERAGLVAADAEPVVEGVATSVRRVRDPLAIALAPDAKGASLAVEVGDVEGDRLGSAQPATVEHRHQGGVASAGRTRVRSGGEERAQLAGGQAATGRQPRPLHALDRDRAVVLLG
jgi:hypothetical protein